MTPTVSDVCCVQCCTYKPKTFNSRSSGKHSYLMTDEAACFWCDGCDHVYSNRCGEHGEEG